MTSERTQDKRRRRFIAASIGVFLALPGSARAADHVKIGIQRVMGYPGVPVAMAQGYFAAEGIEPELVFFDAAQPTAVAVASGSLDFGVAGISAAFYELAGGGRLRLIASSVTEAPGFRNLAVYESNEAYGHGLDTIRKLSGHSVAVTQFGSGLEYEVGMIAEKNHVAFETLTVKALQSNGNIVSALEGAAVDAAVMPGTPGLGPADAGKLRLLGWVGDLADRTMVSAVVVSKPVADRKPALVQRFLRAYRKGQRDFHDAFADDADHRRDGPTAPAILAIMAKFTGLPAEKLVRAVPFADPEGRISMPDLTQQIDWHVAHGRMKHAVDPASIVDKRFAELATAR
ncbi:MAG: ABC transporter substrate-binding protein [Stellaceae bacterium]